MQKVDALITRFPGPVTLHVTRRKRLVVFPLAVAGTAFWAWFLFTYHKAPLTWGETIFVLIAMLFCGWIAVNAAVLLRDPSRGRLTLDAEGFEIANPFWSVRRCWRDVSEFRVETVWRPS